MKKASWDAIFHGSPSFVAWVNIPSSAEPWGQSEGFHAVTGHVPKPDAMGLLGIAVCGWNWYRRAR
jgi:hypothetical protein